MRKRTVPQKDGRPAAGQRGLWERREARAEPGPLEGAGIVPPHREKPCPHRPLKIKGKLLRKPKEHAFKKALPNIFSHWI